MFLTMLAGFAEMERKLNGERTAAALAAQEGPAPGVQPDNPTASTVRVMAWW